MDNKGKQKGVLWAEKSWWTWVFEVRRHFTCHLLWLRQNLYNFYPNNFDSAPRLALWRVKLPLLPSNFKLNLILCSGLTGCVVVLICVFSPARFPLGDQENFLFFPPPHPWLGVEFRFPLSTLWAGSWLTKGFCKSNAWSRRKVHVECFVSFVQIRSKRK